jgi:glycosyltransferase involved in cell wall biosynthesis
LVESEVVFVTPSPRMLRVGAVWVLVQNWLEGSRRRWGSARVLTPTGVINDEQVRVAAWGETSLSANSRRRGFALRLAATFVKDTRSLLRTSRFDRRVRLDPPEVNPLFVWQYHSLFQRAGLTIGRQRNCPLVLFVDAPQVWEAAMWGVRRPGWGRLVERYGEKPQFRSADLVACVSEEVAEATISRGAIPDRVIITPGTADSIRQRVSTVDMRPILGLGQASVVGWVGSFRAFHHAEMLVRAVAHLQQDREVSLVMVGEGATRASCIDLAAELGLRKAVFPGFVPHEHIGDVLKAFDVAVMTRGPGEHFHGSPTKLKEYLAAGRAVVAPRIGEVSRMFRDGHDLLTYSPGNQHEMQDAIQRLLDDRVLRTKLELEGQATYDRLFTMDRQLDFVAQRLHLPSGFRQVF